MKFKGTEAPTKFIKENLVVGLLANNRIIDPIAEGIFKNLTEFYTQEFFLGGTSVVYGETPEDLMEQAAELGKSHLLALKVGNLTTSFLDCLINYFERFYDGETLVGHILDRGNNYYEIHPQCFIVDVNWWVSENKPNFGNRDMRNAKWEATEPERSTDNWHDDYTPKWIKPGNNVRGYNGKEYGWNIIEHSLRSGKVGIWQKNMRQAKTYLYPEVKEAWEQNKQDILQILDTSKFFCSNTEDIHVNSTIVADTVICTAGGPSPILHAFAYNMKAGGNLVITDVSPVALAILEDMCKTWDGRDYAGWLNEYKNKSTAIKSRLIALGKIDNQSEWIDNIEGFQEWFENEWPHIHKSFVKLSILDTSKYIRRIDKFMRPDNTVVIHTSNIFHFLPTSLFYDYNTRHGLFLKLTNYVNKKRQETPGLRVVSRILFNDSHRKIMEILPWYKKIKD